jgi:hypothetical protein
MKEKPQFENQLRMSVSPELKKKELAWNGQRNLISDFNTLVHTNYKKTFERI